MERACAKCGLAAPAEAIHCPRCGEPLYRFPGWRVLSWSVVTLVVITLIWGYAVHWF